MIPFRQSFIPLQILLMMSVGLKTHAQDMYSIQNGKIHFVSNAPEENIEAMSRELSGLMNIVENTFAFSVYLKTFKGFNSPLQQEHFYENYMQTDIFPRSTFTGKLIDKFDPNTSKQKVRAKGQFEIHGIKKERIIEVNLTKTNKGFLIESEFNVLLEDHGIQVPQIVFQKIAANINVSITGEMLLK